MLRSSSSSSSISSLPPISIMVIDVMSYYRFYLNGSPPKSTNLGQLLQTFLNSISGARFHKLVCWISLSILDYINFLIFIFHPVLDLLWVAPEILRLPNRPIRGTQKGDVYSFAIILQEFHTREGTYSSSYMDPKGISKFPYRLVVVVLILEITFILCYP